MTWLFNTNMNAFIWCSHGQLPVLFSWSPVSNLCWAGAAEKKSEPGFSPCHCLCLLNITTSADSILLRKLTDSDLSDLLTVILTAGSCRWGARKNSASFIASQKRNKYTEGDILFFNMIGGPVRGNLRHLHNKQTCTRSSVTAHNCLLCNFCNLRLN